jgi:hypothetical protein
VHWLLVVVAVITMTVRDRAGCAPFLSAMAAVKIAQAALFWGLPQKLYVSNRTALHVTARLALTATTVVLQPRCCTDFTTCGCWRCRRAPPPLSACQARCLCMLGRRSALAVRAHDRQRQPTSRNSMRSPLPPPPAG